MGVPPMFFLGKVLRGGGLLLKLTASKHSTRTQIIKFEKTCELSPLSFSTKK